MLDSTMRGLIDPPLNAAGKKLAEMNISANAVTLSGIVPGVAAVAALAGEAYILALILILINRLTDGLDGAVARAKGPTDLGGYLDIVTDFLFYAAVPVGFALAHPDQNALPAAVLVASFIGTGSSFLAYAIVAEKRGLSTDIRGKKSFYYLGGITEGTETIGLFVVCCLFPDLFPVFAYIFAALCAVTTATRIAAAFVNFRDSA